VSGVLPRISHRSRPTSPWARACIVLAVVTGGCGRVGSGDPPHGAPTEAAGSSGATGSGAGSRSGANNGDSGNAGAGGVSGSQARTVAWRSPFGNLTPGNLLVNGDFEWGIGVAVPGWYAVADGQMMGFRYRTGGACRSGLLCAEISGGQTLIATLVTLPPPEVGSAPSAARVLVSGFARPRSGPCSAVTVTLVAETFHPGGSTSEAWTVPVVAPPPGNARPRDGYCAYQGTFVVQGAHDYASLAVSATDATLLDDFGVFPAPPPLPGAGSHESATDATAPTSPTDESAATPAHLTAPHSPPAPAAADTGAAAPPRLLGAVQLARAQSKQRLENPGLRHDLRAPAELRAAPERSHR
jgi:hypothetical protein